MKLYSILAALVVLAISCKKPVEEPGVQLPTNLETIVTATEGLVELQASASGANFFTTTFYDGSNAVEVESNDGIASYTFIASGSYTISTKAHATYAEYIEKTETVSVSIPSPSSGIPSTGYSTPMSYPGYSLVWNDEFDGSSLSSAWTYDIGTGSWGWGNNELQYYRTENAVVDSGVLTITAKAESFDGQSYTSSRIKTQGLTSFQYGRIDIRAVLPYGQGIWPALWMLGDNISTVGWPQCGEIDIMELVGGTSASGAGDNRVHGTLHWDEGGHANFGGSNALSSGIFADEWHVFSIIWDSNQIRFLRDDVQYHVMNISGAEKTEFHQNFFFIFNIAVGGNWPGSPDASTVFPQRMYVDYVRVFQ